MTAVDEARCPRRLAAERSIVNGSHEVLHSVTRESGDRQHQVTQRCTRRLDLYFDVVPQTIEAIHQFAFGQVGEVATQHGRDLGLRDPHAAGRLDLGEAELASGLGDLDHQAGLDLELVGFRQTEVCEDVARTGFDLDAVNRALDGRKDG
jgi:hypothetical protein